MKKENKKKSNKKQKYAPHNFSKKRRQYVIEMFDSSSRHKELFELDMMQYISDNHLDSRHVDTFTFKNLIEKACLYPHVPVRVRKAFRGRLLKHLYNHVFQIRIAI